MLEEKIKGVTQCPLDKEISIGCELGINQLPPWKTANLEWRWKATNVCCWTSWILQDEMIELFSCEVCYAFRQTA